MHDEKSLEKQCLCNPMIAPLDDKLWQIMNSDKPEMTLTQLRSMLKYDYKCKVDEVTLEGNIHSVQIPFVLQSIQRAI